MASLRSATQDKLDLHYCHLYCPVLKEIKIFSGAVHKRCPNVHMHGEEGCPLQHFADQVEGFFSDADVRTFVEIIT